MKRKDHCRSSCFMSDVEQAAPQRFVGCWVDKAGAMTVFAAVVSDVPGRSAPRRFQNRVSRAGTTTCVSFVSCYLRRQCCSTVATGGGAPLWPRVWAWGSLLRYLPSDRTRSFPGSSCDTLFSWETQAEIGFCRNRDREASKPMAALRQKRIKNRCTMDGR